MKPSCCLTVFEKENVPTDFVVDLIDGDSPLVAGSDTKTISSPTNIGGERYIFLQRPTVPTSKELGAHIFFDKLENERSRSGLAP